MSHENEILDLINSSAGKAAPYMTERLRTIGDGKMSAGVNALTRYAAKYGMEIGEIKSLKKGLGLGALGTLTIVGATMMAFDFYRKKKERIIELRQVDSKMEAQATEQEDTEQEDTEQEDTEQQNQENKIEEEPLN